MTKHERISRDLQRLKDKGRVVLEDPEVWRLEIDTLPNGRYEVTSFYTALEALECL